MRGIVVGRTRTRPPRPHPAHDVAVGLDFAGPGADHDREIARRESRLLERDLRAAHREQGHPAHETRFRAVQSEVPWIEGVAVGAHQLAPGLALDPGFVDGERNLRSGLQNLAVRVRSGADLGKEPHAGDDRITGRASGEGRFGQAA